MTHANATPLFALPTLRILTITGADAASYLQRQLCNDVEQANAHQWQWQGWCSAKGRLLLLGWFRQVEDQHFQWLLPEAALNKALPRLRMFVLRDQVSLNVEDDQACYGYLGDTHDAANLHWAAALPAGDTNQAAPGIGLGPATLDSVMPDTSPWLQAMIASGLPILTEASIEQFIPQWLNLDRLNGIGFKKGCYPGQEIVARTHYLGKLKKRSFILTSNTTLTAGQRLFAKAGDPQAVAEVIYSTQHDGQHWALAVCQISATNQPLLTEDEQSVQVSAPPYSLAEAESPA